MKEEDDYYKIIKEVYKPTGSYKKVNKVLAKKYLEERTEQNRNDLLIQNIFLSRRAVSEMMKAFDVPGMYREDLLSIAIESMLTALDEGDIDKYLISNISFHLYYRARRGVKKWILENIRPEEPLTESTLVTDELREKDTKNYYSWMFDYSIQEILHDREAYIIESFFYTEMSIYELSLRLGLTETRVRQILFKSIRKLGIVFLPYSRLDEWQIDFRKEVEKRMRRRRSEATKALFM